MLPYGPRVAAAVLTHTRNVLALMLLMQTLSVDSVAQAPEGASYPPHQWQEPCNTEHNATPYRLHGSSLDHGHRVSQVEHHPHQHGALLQNGSSSNGADLREPGSLRLLDHSNCHEFLRKGVREANQTNVDLEVAKLGVKPDGNSTSRSINTAEGHTEQLNRGLNPNVQNFLLDSTLLRQSMGQFNTSAWLHSLDPSVIEQPASFVKQDWDTKQWFVKDKEWLQLHHKYTKQLNSHKELDLVVYGDSLFETILESVIGHHVARANGVFPLWEAKHSNETTGLLALAGETTTDMLWRLLNGELPFDVKVKQILLEIGSNNLVVMLDESHIYQTALTVTKSVTSIVELILTSCPDTQLVLAGLLPRGIKEESDMDKKYLLPNRYTEVIYIINTMLRAYVEKLTTQRVTWVDCSSIVVRESSKVPGALEINADLLPDSLHPSAEGFQRLLDECYEPALELSTKRVWG